MPFYVVVDEWGKGHLIDAPSQAMAFQQVTSAESIRLAQSADMKIYGFREDEDAKTE